MFFLSIICFVNIILTIDAARTVIIIITILNILFKTIILNRQMGPLGNIILNSVIACKDKPTGDAIQVSNLEAKSIDDKGNKALFFDMVIKTPIDATTQVSVA